MKILVACEESQAVTIELRRLGHDAFSYNIIECSGGHSFRFLTREEAEAALEAMKDD